MYYEVETPLKSLASVSTPDAQTIAIQPFDKSCIGDVERAILDSDVGLVPNSDGNIIRLNVPQLTTERRKVRRSRALPSEPAPIRRPRRRPDAVRPSHAPRAARRSARRAQELVKTVGKLAEQGKVALRNVRRDALKEISALSGLSEDTVKEAEENVQKLTDRYVKQVEDLSKSKEDELMTV